MQFHMSGRHLLAVKLIRTFRAKACRQTNLASSADQLRHDPAALGGSEQALKA
jgi:hypothetical protein